jgi:hypothetical protein
MSTGLGEEGDDVVTGVGGLEEAEGTLVTGLAAPFAVGARRSGRSFGSARQVGRGRPRGVLGVLVEASGEGGHLGLKLGHLLLKLKEAGLGLLQWSKLGEEGLAARTVGVGCAHALEVRGGRAKSLPT